MPNRSQPTAALTSRVRDLVEEHQQQIYRQTDRMFAFLMIVQWLAGIAAAVWISPRTWTGQSSQIHPYIWTAIFFGGLICWFPAILAMVQPGKALTRYTIAVAEMLVSALLIHLTGGRIETHFHVFGALAFLSFYRDWKVLIPATAVVALDHLIRGIYYPQSVFGVLLASHWRWLEHVGWVAFEDIILIKSCLRGVAEIGQIAERQVKLELINETTERSVVERTVELTESEALLKALVGNANEGIVIADSRGRIISVNPKAEEIFGRSAAESIGELFSILIPARLQEAHRKGMETFVEKGSLYTLGEPDERAGVRKNGKEFPLDISVSKWKAGGNTFFNAMIRDLTEQKRLEGELVQAHKLESIGQLAAGIAHEINTPIQYVGDNTTFIQDAVRDLLKLAVACDQYVAAHESECGASVAFETMRAARRQMDLEFLRIEAPKAIDESLEGVTRVAAIVRAMKEFSHPGPPERIPTDINRAIHNTTLVSKNEWKYIADLVEDFDASLPPVPCLAGEINQVVLNLIVNAAHAIADAVKLTPGRKGKITVQTRYEPEWARIEVHDTGSGIPEHARPHVFNLFFTTKDVGKGTGQGLAFAYASIVHKHGGKISFETEDGVGTRFTIRLPLVCVQEGAD